ncbi:MAG: PilZ domain-containing protein [Spirochaetales bacterium]|nr:PilZ domain-containing protein [Spirochaetales bacterium]
MKTLIVAEKEAVIDHIEKTLRPHGLDFINYRNPLKALDNLEEISPDIVIFSAEDFPRHWKPFLRLLREYKTKEACVFILLKGESFDYDEAAKATFLGVNGVLQEELDDPADLQVIEDIISRYLAFREIRLDKRYYPEDFDNIQFVFSHPVTFHMVTGAVLDITPEGLQFRPDFPALSRDLANGSDVENATLKIGEKILSCDVHVVRNTGNIAFRFLRVNTSDKQAIVDYLNDRASRELSFRTSVG